jgi:hypothetical protein
MNVAQTSATLREEAVINAGCASSDSSVIHRKPGVENMYCRVDQPLLAFTPMDPGVPR